MQGAAILHHDQAAGPAGGVPALEAAARGAPGRQTHPAMAGRDRNGGWGAAGCPHVTAYQPFSQSWAAAPMQYPRIDGSSTLALTAADCCWPTVFHNPPPAGPGRRHHAVPAHRRLHHTGGPRERDPEVQCQGLGGIHLPAVHPVSSELLTRVLCGVSAPNACQCLGLRRLVICFVVVDCCSPTPYLPPLPTAPPAAA